MTEGGALVNEAREFVLLSCETAQKPPTPPQRHPCSRELLHCGFPNLENCQQFL